MSNLVGNPEDRFSRVEAQITCEYRWSKINEPPLGKTNNLHKRKQRRRSEEKSHEKKSQKKGKDLVRNKVTGKSYIFFSTLC